MSKESLSRDEILSNFGDRLRAERKSKGLSQEELAYKAELDRSYVGGVERGERNLTLVNIVALADALEIRPALLLESVGGQRSKD